jgi:alanine racemase
VTAVDLGEDEPGAVGASAPRVLISRAALHANASEIGAAVPDLRRDAWGHGIRIVAEILVDAGVREALVDGRDARAVAAIGLSPLTDGIAAGDALYGSAADARAAMTLRGTVLATKRLRTGEGVSYGFLHRAPADTRVALVTGGYAQGVVRSLGGQASVVVDGRRLRIIGRVAMDVCVVDIEDADIPRGATATFFGDPATGVPAIGEWVAATGLSAAEILTTVGLRATREWTE